MTLMPTLELLASSLNCYEKSRRTRMGGVLACNDMVKHEWEVS